MKIKSIGILIASVVGAFASDFQISASLDRTQIGMGDQAVLSVSLSGSSSSLPEPELPSLPDVQIYNAGTSQSFSWVNGKSSAQVNYNFVLSPKKEGSFTIGPIKAGGQETAPLTLHVSGHSTQRQSAGNASGMVSGFGRANPSARQNPTGAAGLFITTSLNKETAFVGEPVILSFKLYTRTQLLSQPNYQAPSTSGFWAEDLPPQRTYTADVKGVPYNVVEIRTALFPTVAGNATIGPATLQARVQDFSDPFGDDFFASFFSGGGKVKTLQTDPIRLNVKPLPEPKPSDFKGAVGSYHVNASLDKSTVEVGQPFTYTLTVSGKGNIKSIPDMSLPTLANFRTFDTNVVTNIDKKGGFVEGSKVFRTVLIPTIPGTLTIPAVSFSYFDPASASYKTVSTQAQTIQATGSASALPALPGNGGAVSSNTPGIQMHVQDIRYIKTPMILNTRPSLWYRSPLFIWGHVGIFLISVFGFLFPWARKKYFSDPVQTRFKSAAVQFEVAAKHIEKNLKESSRKASDELSDAFRDFLSAKLQVDKNELNLKKVLAYLSDSSVSDELKKTVQAVWQQIELFQFAPSQVTSNELVSTLQETRACVEKLNDVLVWKREGAPGRRPLQVKLILMVPFVFASFLQADDTWQQANAAYAKGDFAQAVQSYEQLRSSDPGWELYYNLGNAYYRLGQNGKAVVNYQRAFRLASWQSDVLFNLDLVSTHIGEPFAPAGLGRIFWRTFYFPPINALIILEIGLFVLGVGLFMVKRTRTISIEVMVGVGLIWLISAFWLGARIYLNERAEGVVITSSADVRGGPSESTPVSFSIPEGRRVFILDQAEPVAGWTEIGVPKEGLKGWVVNTTIERI